MKKSEYYAIIGGISLIVAGQQSAGTFSKAVFNVLVIYLMLKALWWKFKEQKGKI